MIKEVEPKRIRQYCFSIRNPIMVSSNLEKHGVKNAFQNHSLIFARSLPEQVVASFENWLSKILNENKIEIDSLRLDFISISGLLNYAIFADSRQKIIEKLKKLKGFSSVGDETL